MSKQLFKVGDVVENLRGEVVTLEASPQIYKKDYPIYDGQEGYTEEGKLLTDNKHPSIWHVETGSAPKPGERPFEYPIYKKAKLCGIIEQGLVVRFDSLECGEVIVGSDNYKKGFKCRSWNRHNSGEWEDCEKPTFKPTKPTWCWCGMNEECAKAKMLVLSAEKSDNGTMKYMLMGDSGEASTWYEYDKPCSEDEIPTWWKELIQN